MDYSDPMWLYTVITACLPATIAKGMLFNPQNGQMKGKLVTPDKDV